jgi:hypothetical protein
MNKIEEQKTFISAKKRLKSLITQLEDRLKKTDEATEEARRIKNELEKLKEQR